MTNSTLANPKLANPKTSGRSNTEKDPDDWVSGDEPMTGAQASYLKTLSEERTSPTRSTTHCRRPTRRNASTRSRTKIRAARDAARTSRAVHLLSRMCSA